MITVLYAIASICFAIYLVSIIETIGSYLLSVSEFVNYSMVYLMMSIFIPPLAPVFAWAIFSTAKELYDTKTSNKTQVDESFYGYVLHGFNTINQWSNK